jgi:hypothetical protein
VLRIVVRFDTHHTRAERRQQVPARGDAEPSGTLDDQHVA